MISETPSPAISALPVRRRETLEIFDTALKLYRRYFWVLIGWSAIMALSLVTVYFASFFYLFMSPLLYGAVSCCVAAAVRGQNVGFRQCWEFTKPRYGAMLGALLLASILFGVALIIFYIAAILIGIGGAFALANAPVPVQVIGGVLGVLALMVGFSVLGVFAFAWLTMVPIVSCLEDDKRGVPALGRSYDLLKGNWRRVFGMALLIGLAVLAFFAIIGGLYGLIAGIASLGALVDDSSGAILALAAAMTGFWGLFTLLWSPAQTLIIAVLYLDLRVRREALDLEWSAYTTTPPPLPNEAVVNAEGDALSSAPSGLMQPTGSQPGWDAGPTSLAAGGMAAAGAVDSATSGLNLEKPSELSATSFSPPVASPDVTVAVEPPVAHPSFVPPVSDVPSEPLPVVSPPVQSIFEGPVEPVVPVPLEQTPQTPQMSGDEARRDT